MNASTDATPAKNAVVGSMFLCDESICPPHSSLVKAKKGPSNHEMSLSDPVERLVLCSHDRVDGLHKVT